MNDVSTLLPKKERDRRVPEAAREVPQAPIGIGFNSDVNSVVTEKIPTPVVVDPLIDKKVVSAKKVHVKRTAFRKRVLLWARDIGMALLVAVLIMQFVRPTLVQQHSMEDTLQENDYIFLNRQTYNFGGIAHGDIFVFRFTAPLGSPESSKNLIKRVIGLPGDTVAIRDGKVYVNEQVIDDSHTKDGYTDGYMDEMMIPDGYIFAMGDNRQNSFDSRDPLLGLIDMRDVVGKAFFRVFPIGKAGFVD